MSNTNMSNANMSNTNMSNTNMSNANMSNANMSKRNILPMKRNKTQKKAILVKSCKLGIHKTIKPCCNRYINGSQCHVNPNFLDANTGKLTPSNSLQMEKEHKRYKRKEKKLFGDTNNQPTRAEITRKLNAQGINEIINERNSLQLIINMRKKWLKKWYIPPSDESDCYACDANSRNHSLRITILEDCLKNYDDVIANNEKNAPVSSRTRQALKTLGPSSRLNITRKKNKIERVDYTRASSKFSSNGSDKENNAGGKRSIAKTKSKRNKSKL